MKRFLVAALLMSFALAAPAAQADDSFIGVSWGVGIPTGDSKDFTSGTSFRGIAFEGRYERSRNYTLGFYVGWQVFDDKTAETAEISTDDGGGHVSGTQFRYINAFPLLVTGHYYLGGDGSYQATRFYAGGGAGMFAMERRMEIGVYAFQETKWHFGLAPEIGVHFPLGWETRGFASIKYNYAFKSGDKTESWVGFNLGLATF